MNKKNDQPYMPFYFGDWFKAMDLQSLPRDTKCVWFEMLGRMWESNERGYLTINGKPMSDFAKANLLGFGSNVSDYLQHEQKLEEAGIFSRREDGAIYSRFMLKIVSISAKRKISGSKGGSKTQANNQASAKANGKANSEYENEYEYETDTDVVNINNIEEPMAQKIGEKDFDLLWKRYPNRQGRKNALRHFTATVKTTEDLSAICKAIDNYIQSGNVKNGFIKNGSTWFNEWQDWIEPSTEMMKGNSNGNTRKVDSQIARATFAHGERELANLRDLEESLRNRHPIGS